MPFPTTNMDSATTNTRHKRGVEQEFGQEIPGLSSVKEGRENGSFENDVGTGKGEGEDRLHSPLDIHQSESGW